MTLNYSIKRVDKPTGDPLRRKLWRGCRLAAGYSSFTFLEGLLLHLTPGDERRPRWMKTVFIKQFKPLFLQGVIMETYKDLLDRKPKETLATVTVDGVEAALDYSLERYGTIIARYEETYTAAELSWLQGAETVELTGRRRYHDGDNQSGVSSTIELAWRQDAVHVGTDSLTHYYHGESRRNALKQMEAIVTAVRTAIDAIGNSDNQDFEAELDAAVRESVTGGEAE